jgi:hypothetical protein
MRAAEEATFKAALEVVVLEETVVVEPVLLEVVMDITVQLILAAVVVVLNIMAHQQRAVMLTVVQALS